jgi:hypothetical protein
MCSQVLDGLKMIYLCFKKSNANLVINTTCMLLYLSRAIYIFEWKNLVYKVYFWMSYFSPWFLWVETKKLVIPFLLSILLLAFLSVHCVSHIGDLTNLVGYPPLKPKIIFCVYLFDHNLSLSMDCQFKEDRKMVPRLKISSISRKEKYF